ncbi:hypothetical protein [Leptolyngbya sp. FACHB-17]|uniref:hypothetical protein n=1 Tax=unclassified Leptolyngbya TaxID=2650499 RepID=UPI001680ADE7|nr:hypothetical protein [Leptolyngbya sp. FACHB-17]MBD2079741.1 hypothetical protein [Leptolyngbya sp. FACHB-17]
MTIKEEILKELDRIPEDQLPALLEHIQQLNAGSVSRKERFTTALQDSLTENAELYTRLADA